MIIADFFRQLYESTGWNFPIFYNGWLAKKFAAGILLTTQLAIASFAGALAIGFFCVVARRAEARWPAAIVAAYVEIFRNTPGLAQLYFLFFGLGSWLGLSTGGPDGAPSAISPLTFVVVSLAFHHGAFVAEALRGSVDSVPRGIVESAAALGYGRWQAFGRILLPLAFRSALPALGNVAAQIVKGTALAYAIAVPETLYVTHEIWSEQFNVVEMMNVVLVVYLALMAVVTGVFRLLEAWLRVPGYGR